jgi:hypothetical protein
MSRERSERAAINNLLFVDILREEGMEKLKVGVIGAIGGAILTAELLKEERII